MHDSRRGAGGAEHGDPTGRRGGRSDQDLGPRAAGRCRSRVWAAALAWTVVAALPGGAAAQVGTGASVSPVPPAQPGASTQPISLISPGASIPSTQSVPPTRSGASIPPGAPADGSTPLLWASHHDDLDRAARLIRDGADVDAANDLGATPLWAASQNGSAAMVRLLLDAGADPDLALLSGETPVMVAARAGSPAVVDLLARAGAALDRRGSRGQTALMWAAAQRHPEVVRTLLAHGADLALRSDVWTQVMAVPPHSQPEYNREIPHGGNTALLFAVRAGDPASTRALIEAGADVDDADAWGVSAVGLAAHGGHAALLDVLLARGANPNAAAAGFAPLHAAVMRNDPRMTAALLAHGADPDAPLRTWTPTRRASRDRHYPPPLVGATPFWLAARFARPDLMRRLAAHGADPQVVHEVDYIVDGRLAWRTERTTALMAALGMGGRRARAWTGDGPAPEARILEAVRLAVALGVDVNARDADGRTALDEAEALQLEPVVRFLVSQGAEPGAD